MKTLKYIFICLVILSAYSCQEEIDLNLKDEKFSRLVVDGFFSDEFQKQTIYLSKTTNYSKNEPAPKVSGAIVSVSDGINTFNFSETEPGIYQTDSIAGEVGKTYNLSINYDGKTYNAESKMNPVTKIDSIRLVYLFTAEGKDHYEWRMSAQDSSLAGQYYLSIPYIDDIKFNNFLFWATYSDDYINGTYLNDMSMGVIEFENGNIFKLKWYAIDKKYSNYILQLQANGMQNPLFGGPPANVIGNISNGALGYFIATSVTEASTMVPAH
ncbi:MAG: DUF4249 domain-containing protein [Bacteroidetes bacterium]|nr:DUF4249 domain-containing protein [Bacteroidota bacterium]